MDGRDTLQAIETTFNRRPQSRRPQRRLGSAKYCAVRAPFRFVVWIPAGAASKALRDLLIRSDVDNQICGTLTVKRYGAYAERDAVDL